MTNTLTLQKYLAASVVATLAKTALFWFLIAIALICAIWAARAQQSNTAEAERYIKESESQWAESVANGDASVVERILADDFLGVDPDGNLYEKAKMVADTREAPKEFISNHLNDVKVRFFGDTDRRDCHRCAPVGAHLPPSSNQCKSSKPRLLFHPSSRQPRVLLRVAS